MEHVKTKLQKSGSGKNSVIRTLGYIKPYWLLVFISSICGVIKLTIPMILPQVLKYFTDDVLSASSILTTQQKIDEIYKWLMILAGIYVFVLIPSTYLRVMCAIKASNKVMNNIRRELYAHIQKMSSSFHNKNKSGAIVSVINNDIDMVHDFIWRVASAIWMDALILVILVILMLRINVPLTVLSAIALPVTTVVTKKIRTQMKNGWKQAQEERADMSAFVQERTSGYAVVKLFNNSKNDFDVFTKHTDLLYKYRMKAQRLFAFGESIIFFFSELIMAIVICLSAIIIVKGNMTIGDLIIFYSYLGFFNTPLYRFSELNVVFASSMAGVERVYEILDTPPDIEEKADAVKIDESEPMDIEFSNVTFQYDKTHELPNLNDISFSIKEGEKVALVGSSGCGKTTVVSLLARFYDVDSGRITVSGRDIRDYQLDSFYKQIGMVFQDTILFSGTIEENLRYGDFNANEEQLINASKAANAYEFIEKTPNGFKTILGEKGIGLSGGQKQRIAIARVFLKNPKLLILDEATSALDSESEGLVQEALDSLMKDRTSVIIAHRLSTIINVDKIIVMDTGRIVEAGTHEELLKNGGRYKELYDKQFKDVLN